MLLRAYAVGLFPMAPARESEDIEWYAPPSRGILPLDGGFHTPRKLRRLVHSGAFEVRTNTAFRTVMEACAAPTPGREESWISPGLVELYSALHDRGCAHSVEIWREGTLVGGLYGVALRGAFFGESMFSRVVDASKVALVHLVAALRKGGFVLLDTQYHTDHLAQFGCQEVPAEHYQRRLDAALDCQSAWPACVDRISLKAELAALQER